jgi:hypothetical protein
MGTSGRSTRRRSRERRRVTWVSLRTTCALALPLLGMTLGAPFRLLALLVRLGALLDRGQIHRLEPTRAGCVHGANP